MSARVDSDDQAWVKARADEEEIEYPDFIRRMVAFARLHMPIGWTKPVEPAPPATQGVEGPTDEEETDAGPE